MPYPVLSKIPLLRVLIPFATGIVAAQYQSSIWWAALILLMGIVLYTGLWFTSKKNTAQTIRFRQRAFAPIFLIIFAIGNIHALLQEPPIIDTHKIEGKMAIARIEDLRHTDFSSIIQATLFQVEDSSTTPIKLLLTTRGCNYTLEPGDIITFSAHLRPIVNNGNPHETDYAKIQHDRGFIYKQHLRVDHLFKAGHHQSLMNSITRFRHKLENIIINSSLDSDTQSFMIALLLGDASHIDQETRYAYSCAGVAHILALSGLHMGIFTLLIWILLYPLDYLRLKKLRFVITMLILVAFAILTGLSASVVRATIMTIFVFTGYIFFRKSTPLNALIAAAIVILLITPSALYNAGFQLSFITVAAIIIFSPKSNQHKHKKNAIISYVKSSITISAIAMLSTIVLTAYYFHSISFASVISNLLVIPLLTLVMAFGCIFFLLSIAGIELTMLTNIVNALFHLIDYIVNTINGTGVSHIDNIYMSRLDVVIYYGIVILAAVAIKLKSWRPAIVSGGLLAAGVFMHAYRLYQLPQRGLVVLNSYSSSPVFFFEKSQGYLWIPDIDSVDINKFKRYYAGMLAYQQIDSISVIDPSGMNQPWAYVNPPFACICGTRIAIITNKRDKAFSSPQLPETDIALITKRCHAAASEVHERYQNATIMLSGGIYEPEYEEFLAECDSANLQYYSVKSMGAWEKYQ